MSIRGKLTLIIMGISGIAILLTAGAIALYLSYDLREGRIRELEVAASIMADRNKAALAFLDNEQARSNLRVFDSDAYIVSACLYDENGALFADYVNPAYRKHRCPEEAAGAGHYPEGMLTAYKDIASSQGKIGGVYIASDLGEVEESVRRIALISLAIAAVVSAVALALAMYFQRSISAPIVGLMETARSVARDQDYSLRAPQSGRNDEVGALAHSFNEMVQEIEKRDMDLLEVNNNLERMVHDRTRDLEEAKKKAEFASEAKSEFLRNMSHEFRTPLHAMTSFAAYGIKEAGSADRETLSGYFNIIQTGAERLSKLVNEVLNLSRLESGHQSFLMRRHSLEHTLKTCLATVESLTKDKDIKLIFNTPERYSECVFDQDRVTQVLTNILGNAVKFTPHGKRIWLEYREEDSHPFGMPRPMLSVSVKDEGVGIAEEELDKIFDSFVQGSRTNQGTGGTGLGLAISRIIMRAHEGIIFASNNEAGGASFTFMFPRDLQEGDRVIDVKSAA